MSNLVDYAKKELEKVELKCEDKESLEMQQQMTKHLVGIVEEFSKEGHSGFSASYAISMLERLLRFLPLTPLTGEDDEWTKLDYDKDTCYQNKRCSAVFKNKDGNAYHIEGKVFSDDGGKSWFTSKDSKIYIDFPYYVPTSPEKVLLESEE